MKSCRKCDAQLGDRTLSCPHCGASQTLDVRLSIVAMKLLGVLCGIVGVGLLVFADPLGFARWLWAGLFILIGFVMFYRSWKEYGD